MAVTAGVRGHRHRDGGTRRRLRRRAVATLPIAAGPAYVFVALDHDSGFIAASALSSFVVNAVTAVYALVYAAVAQRRGLAVSMAAAFAVWAILAAMVRSVEWGPIGAVLFNVVVIGSCVALGRRFRDAPMPLVTRRWYDVPLRAVMAAVQVAVVVALSTKVGPGVTGILAVFPIVLTNLMLILQPRFGGPASAAVLANTISGLAGFGCCRPGAATVTAGTGSGFARARALPGGSRGLGVGATS